MYNNKLYAFYCVISEEKKIITCNFFLRGGIGLLKLSKLNRVL
jgi:hypothetical protein